MNPTLLDARDPEPPKDERCPNQGKYGYNNHRIVAGKCWICAGEEAARRARLEEKGIFLNG